MGGWLLTVLIAEYVIIAVVYLVERDYPKALYFTGAIILSLGVLWMK